MNVHRVPRTLCLVTVLGLCWTLGVNVSPAAAAALSVLQRFVTLNVLAWW